MSSPAPGSAGGGPSFFRIFLGEMGVRMGMLLVAMALSVGGAAIGGATSDDGRSVGALVGLAVGIVAYAVVLHRFNQRPDRSPSPPDGSDR